MVSAPDVVPVMDTPLFKSNSNITLVDASGEKIIIGIKDSSLAHEIPDSIAGFEVTKIHFPRMKALNCNVCSPSCDPKRIAHTRPIIGGTSVGHYQISAGTIGCIVKDSDGKTYILSNNHVLANTSTVKNMRAVAGDTILQPGPADGGTTPTDRVATLTRWIPLDEDNSNISDAAIAEITTDYVEGWMGKEQGSLISSNGYSISFSPGDVCFKYGRTTGYTENYIVSKTSSISVEYGDTIINFHNQIIFLANSGYENPLCGGDSGSALFDTNFKVIGLCFAGGLDNNGYEIGVASYILPILDTLEVYIPENGANTTCDPGTIHCDNGSIYTCSSEGEWESGGASGVCKPNQPEAFSEIPWGTIIAMVPLMIVGIMFVGNPKE